MGNIIFSLKYICAYNQNSFVATGKCISGEINKGETVKFIRNGGVSNTLTVIDCALSSYHEEYDYILLKNDHKLELNTNYRMTGYWIVDSYHQTMSCFVNEKCYLISNIYYFPGQLYGKPIYSGWETNVLYPNGAYNKIQLNAIQKQINNTLKNIYKAYGDDNIALAFNSLASKEDIPEGSLFFWNINWYKPTTTINEHSHEFTLFVEKERNLEWYAQFIIYIYEQEKSILNKFNDNTNVIENIDKLNMEIVSILNNIFSNIKYVKEENRWRNIIIEHVALKDGILCHKLFSNNDVSDKDVIDALYRIFNIKVAPQQYKISQQYNNQYNCKSSIQWGKILGIGAMFLVKAIARYYGADSDFDFGDIFSGDSDSNFGEPSYEGGDLLYNNENPLYTPQDYAYLNNQDNLAFSSRYEHINSIYDTNITFAEDKYASDLERINNEGPYAWENPEHTLNRDKQYIEELKSNKRQAILRANVDQSKQEYWDKITEYAKESLNRKIHDK